jgi:hypothetical protein
MNEERSGVATFHTDNGGDDPSETRYWIHVFDGPRTSGYEMVTFCSWSEKDMRRAVERMGCRLISQEEFIDRCGIRIEDHHGESADSILRRIGASSYRAAFGNSPFAEPY